MFSSQILDCAREQSDSYTNTAEVSEYRNKSPRIINFRWDCSVSDGSFVEFFNYYSIVPLQAARTFTTRGSFGVYPVTTPEMCVPIARSVQVPHGAVRFRVRLNDYYVTNYVPIRNNETYYVEDGHIHSLYPL